MGRVDFYSIVWKNKTMRSTQSQFGKTIRNIFIKAKRKETQNDGYGNVYSVFVALIVGSFCYLLTDWMFSGPNYWISPILIIVTLWYMISCMSLLSESPVDYNLILMVQDYFSSFKKRYLLNRLITSIQNKKVLEYGFNDTEEIVKSISSAFKAVYELNVHNLLNRRTSILLRVNDSTLKQITKEEYDIKNKLLDEGFKIIDDLEENCKEILSMSQDLRRLDRLHLNPKTKNSMETSYIELGQKIEREINLQVSLMYERGTQFLVKVDEFAGLS